MKIRFALSILVLVLLASLCVGHATETINTDVVSNVDRFGDGSLKMTFHLSAIQWAKWKYQYGDHPDVLWRDIKQENSGFGRTLLGLGLLSMAGGVLFGVFALIFLLRRPATPSVAPAQ